MIMMRIYFSFLLVLLLVSCKGSQSPQENKIIPGAERFDAYVELIENKRIGLVSNQTSVAGKRHLVDTLLAYGINIRKVFAPEHGFRGDKGAGVLIDGGKDPVTGIEIVSLYGSKKKPSDTDLEDLDIVVFDIQDVGARFYTYISTLHYVMEACAENKKELIILDRPNPNGNYIDGPVLDTAFRSFVGMHEVPVVHGMTIAEYAQMINGEGWLNNGLKCKLHIITCLNYDHSKTYNLPIPPSPNLNNQKAVVLYPSLCFFEGTIVSIGRGTNFPFTIYGHPELGYGDFYFKPISISHAAVNPKYDGIRCRGENLITYFTGEIQMNSINLEWIKKAYRDLNKKNSFFTDYFNLLAGNDILQKQIEKGLSEEEIRSSWEEDLRKFEKIRQKYLLYP